MSPSRAHRWYRDYLLNFGDLFAVVKKSLKLFAHLLLWLRNLDVRGWMRLLWSTLVVCLMLAFHFSWESIVFVNFAYVIFLWDLEGRISIGAGLACLVAIMILQFLLQTEILLIDDTATEIVAVWAYYFLCIGVAKQTVDLIRGRE